MLLLLYALKKEDQYLSMQSETGWTKFLGLDCLYVDHQSMIDYQKKVGGRILIFRIEDDNDE
jgi:hypothetical protein